jgi:hypothetical protein
LALVASYFLGKVWVTSQGRDLLPD